jgi:propionyl-CoA carboxylase alpha chain/3-methylcrotonyl-CoA carboxylase alpha subunit/acetyl-CoA/propionyl-CoA carboxylase biotin carboxyl carrier protein
MLSADLRERICQAAVTLASAAGYVNAGTVECIVSQTGEFYFLEMNTRLQVEHPVTEMVTGLDLVEWQIRVAQGDVLPLLQEQVQWQGSAIECRILAEDADAGFVPDTGKVLLLQEPQGPGVRFDNGVMQGASIGADFDSMLAKLIVHGANRDLAISRMRQALQETVMLGVTVNSHFLGRVLAHPEFQVGKTDTAFLERNKESLKPIPLTDEDRRALVAVACAASRDPYSTTVQDPHLSMGAWRN